MLVAMLIENHRPPYNKLDVVLIQGKKRGGMVIMGVENRVGAVGATFPLLCEMSAACEEGRQQQIWKAVIEY